MSYVLYIGQMVEALKKADPKEGARLEAELTGLNETIAKKLAAASGTRVVADAGVWDEQIGAAFEPGELAQVLPSCLEGFDSLSEWVDSGGLPPVEVEQEA